jgi:hypothetical protein
MTKRTSPSNFRHWEEAIDLRELVVDKRSGKRSTAAKSRRRNRRYENRLLSSQLRHTADFEHLDD